VKEVSGIDGGLFRPKKDTNITAIDFRAQGSELAESLIMRMISLFQLAVGTNPPTRRAMISEAKGE
jgi:hypothetical protein